MLVPFIDSIGALIIDFVGTMQENIAFSAIAAVIVGLSLWLFAAQFRGARGPQMPSSVVLHVEDGEVRIALTAVETLVQQAAGQVKGVREVRPSFFNRNDELGVFLRATVAADDSIPELSSQLQKTVMDHVMRIAGIQIAEVKVLVDSVSTGPRNRVELR